MLTATGVLRLDDWNDIEGLLDNVRCISEQYYRCVLKNLFYIEIKDKSIYTIYAIELRDAFSHLVKIFAYDNNFVEDNKIKITRQLERYLGHLEEMLYDTFSRIIKFKAEELYKKLDKTIELPKKKMKYARKILEVRTVRDDITIQQRIAKYNEIIASIEKDYREIT